MATNGITMMPIIVLVSVLSSIGAEYVYRRMHNDFNSVGRIG